MAKLISFHGGTDGGPEPLYDFSTNANPLGPCPSALAAVRAADFSRYPDPHYTQLRRKLADYHDVLPERIVIGAGASELILRLVRAVTGSVQVLGPTFSEYSRCAQLQLRPLLETDSPREFLHLQRTQPGLGFICWPNNPTGTKWPLDFLSEAAHNGKLVIDFAYAPFCPESDQARAEQATAKAFRLYAPNKAFGLCGVRGAYLVAPGSYPSLDALAPSWVIDRAAEAFLGATLAPEALRWFSHCRPQIAAWRSDLAQSLMENGIEVRESPASFLLARVGDGARISAKLRDGGIRVRDASSFGLPEWIRLSAKHPKHQQMLIQQLSPILGLQYSTAGVAKVTQYKIDTSSAPNRPSASSQPLI
jgi:histidinol-phosphate aminotransferase